MITLENKTNGEQVSIHGLRYVQEFGAILARDGRVRGERFKTRWADYLQECQGQVGPIDFEQYFLPAEGWELVPSKRRSHSTQATATATEIVEETQQEAVEQQATDEQPIYCENFERICRDVQAGVNVYMYGPAGCGKSYSAEQIANRLGLPYFEVMQLEFAHDVKGYGDAAGRYVETALYKAMVNGGLLFFDEFDRSTSQVTTVINQVLEARRFDFPVVGMVKAHPNFRIIAAGNTAMNGNNEQYVAANVIDASTRNRFACYSVSYNHKVEMKIAEGNAELVEFIEQCRQAVKLCGLNMIVSYRDTKYLKLWNEDGERAAAMQRSIFFGQDIDTIRSVYGEIKANGCSARNVWLKALRELCEDSQD